MNGPRSLEVWADSFHEGEWFLQGLASRFEHGQVSTTYRYNFQPQYTFRESGVPLFVATVYGDYRGWEPVPDRIKRILEYGKPDIMLYDRAQNRVFFAVEETAAVPTGNQSLQRLERVCFAAEQRIPFVYLVSEYGLHIDGGVRRTSIWPSYLALKLSSQYLVPSLTLLYGDKDHPEEYGVGSGVQDLALISYLFIRDWLGYDVHVAKEEVFARVVLDMGKFISSQVAEISPLLPGRDLLTDPSFLQFIADRIAQYDA